MTLSTIVRFNDAQKSTNEGPDAQSWQVLKTLWDPPTGDVSCNLDDTNTPIFCWVDRSTDALVKLVIGEDLANELVPPHQPDPRDRPVVAMNSRFAWVFFANPLLRPQVLKRYDRTAGPWTDVTIPTSGQPYSDMAASEQFLWLAGKEGTIGANPAG